jgi:hypothetical protein
MVASNPRDQTTFTLLGRAIRSELQDLQMPPNGRDIFSSTGIIASPYRRDIISVQDVGQVTVWPVEVM